MHCHVTLHRAPRLACASAILLGACCIAFLQSCGLLCRLVRDYMDAAPASAVADMAEMLAGPNILHMVHSHAGAHVACHVLALGTAKQRKKVIKAMKGELTCPHSPSVFSLFATKRWSSLYGRPALADFAGQALLCAAR